MTARRCVYGAERHPATIEAHYEHRGSRFTLAYCEAHLPQMHAAVTGTPMLILVELRKID